MLQMLSQRLCLRKLDKKSTKVLFLKLQILGNKNIQVNKDSKLKHKKLFNIYENSEGKDYEVYRK